MEENDKIHQIPINSIDDPDTPIRSRANERTIYDLSDSIRDVGLIQPIIIRSKGDRFEVVAGHRRLIACRVVGMLTVPCILSRSDDNTTDTLRLHENLGREDVNIIDQARFLRRLLDKNKWGVDFLASKMKRSGSFVRDRLAILEWPKDMFEALDTQKLSFAAAKWIAKIDDDNVRRHYLDAAIRSGISSRVAYDWYCSWKNRRLPEPPPLEAHSGTEDEPKVQYYTSRCKFCGSQIAMGDEEVLYAHRSCVEEIEQAIKPTP